MANGVAGAYALAAWAVRALRGRPVWVLTAVAEVVLVVQVVVGALIVSDESVENPSLHTFYGFVGLVSVGLAYSYRSSMRERLEMFYGLVGLFLMGVAIRALTLV